MPDEFELPPAFRAADQASISAHSAFLMSTRLQLLLLVLAGGLGAFSWAADGVELMALLTGIAFLGAAAMRFLLVRRRLHRSWYEGRAAAESLKTLAWRYAVAGEPFSLKQGNPGDSFVAQAGDVVSGLSTLRAAIHEIDLTPTASMGQLRSKPIETRRGAYTKGRLDDQLAWYSRKSDWNRQRARRWSFSIMGFQLGGATGAFLEGFGLINFDLFGLAAAMAASGAAWLETKQHSSLASAYRVAADELRRIRKLADESQSEEAWARFVSEAEGAVSREHTMWKATSSRLRPAGLA